MFNVTIIKLRDIVKVGIILIAIYVLSQIILKNISLKNYLNTSVIFNNSDFLTLGINTESNIIEKISKDDIKDVHEKTEEVEDDTFAFSIKSILQIGSNAFNAKELEKKIVQEENTNVVENETVDNNVTEEIAEVQTQVITENPIAENYNREYDGIKIKNETSYELTDDMLNSDNLEINPNNVIIFHTHTCESYTPTENYTYTASR